MAISLGSVTVSAVAAPPVKSAHTIQRSFAGSNTVNVAGVRQVTMTFVQPSFSAVGGYGNDIIWPGLQSTSGGFMQAGTYLNGGGAGHSGVPIWFYWATCHGCNTTPVYGGPVTPGHRIFVSVGYSTKTHAAQFLIQDKTTGSVLLNKSLPSLGAARYYSGPTSAEWLIERSCARSTSCPGSYLPLEKFGNWTYSGQVAANGRTALQDMGSLPTSSVVMSNAADNGNTTCTNPNVVIAVDASKASQPVVKWCRSR